MKYIGDPVGSIELPDIYRTMFRSDQLLGKRYMISFYRFASCPYCNMSLRQMRFRASELAPDFHMIAIFNSSVAQLRTCLLQYQTSFTILSDIHWRYYRQFGVERSWSGAAKGMLRHWPNVLGELIVHGYVPREFKWKQEFSMPADFLVDEYGKIAQIHWGNDPGDHIEFDSVKAFSHRGMRYAS